MGTIRTVLGDIDSKELGFTMAHEHILTNPKGTGSKNELDHKLDSVEKAIEMCKNYKNVGGSALIESTPESWGRNVAGMVLASKESGVHIVACTGFICEEHSNIREVFEGKSIEQIKDIFVKDVKEGMDGTNVKAGWLKAGAAYNYISDLEEKGIRASARAAIETGTCLHFHTGAGTMGLEIIEIVEQEGLELDRVIIAHVDRFPDWWYHKKMLEKGVNIIYDGPGKAKYYPDSMRVDLIKKIIEHGFEKQLMLSNDMGRRSHHKVYGYGPGFEFIPTKFIPRLLEEGVSQNSIDNFMIHNPARVYSLKEK